MSPFDPAALGSVLGSERGTATRIGRHSPDTRHVKSQHTGHATDTPNTSRTTESRFLNRASQVRSRQGRCKSNGAARGTVALTDRGAPSAPW